MTESNKKEYVKLYVTYRWCQGIEQQFLALQKGFHEVIPQHHLRPFDERELELVIGKDHFFRLQMLYERQYFEF